MPLSASNATTLVLLPSSAPANSIPEQASMLSFRDEAAESSCYTWAQTPGICLPAVPAAVTMPIGHEREPEPGGKGGQRGLHCSPGHRRLRFTPLPCLLELQLRLLCFGKSLRIGCLSEGSLSIKVCEFQHRTDRVSQRAECAVSCASHWLEHIRKWS